MHEGGLPVKTKKERPMVRITRITLEERARTIRLKLCGGNAKIPTEKDIELEVFVLDELIAVRREAIVTATLRISSASAAEIGKLMEERAE